MELPNLPFTSFDKESKYGQYIICDMLLQYKQFVMQLYSDICSTLGLQYSPMLRIELYGYTVMQSDSGNGSYAIRCPGVYTPPGLITISLVDCFISAQYGGKKLGINDMNILFKARLAYVLTHELSHSIQFTFVHKSLKPAMEWANDVNVWTKLFPIIAPMLKKKYKIKIFDEVVNDTCGRVYSYSYEPYTSIGHVLGTLIASIFIDDDIMMGDSSFEYSNQYNEIYNQLVSEKNLRLILRINGTDERKFVLIKDGVVNINDVLSARDFMVNIPVPFNADAMFDKEPNVEDTMFMCADITESEKSSPIVEEGGCREYCKVCPYTDCPNRVV